MNVRPFVFSYHIRFVKYGDTDNTSNVSYATGKRKDGFPLGDQTKIDREIAPKSNRDRLQPSIPSFFSLKRHVVFNFLLYEVDTTSRQFDVDKLSIHYSRYADTVRIKYVFVAFGNSIILE